MERLPSGDATVWSGSTRTVDLLAVFGQFQTVALTSQLAGKQPLPRGERHLVIPGRHRVLSTYLSRST